MGHLPTPVSWFQGFTNISSINTSPFLVAVDHPDRPFQMLHTSQQGRAAQTGVQDSKNIAAPTGSNHFYQDTIYCNQLRSIDDNPL